MTLNQYIKNTGLVADSSNVGIFSFVFCIICYLRVLLPLCQKLIVISFCLCSHWSKKIERARNERRIKGRAKSDKEGDNTLQLKAMFRRNGVWVSSALPCNQLDLCSVIRSQTCNLEVSVLNQYRSLPLSGFAFCGLEFKSTLLANCHHLSTSCQLVFLGTLCLFEVCFEYKAPQASSFKHKP